MARTHGHGNPNWTRDETLLALELYFDCQGNITSRDENKVQALSGLLRQFPYHAKASRQDSFRNLASIVFKLQNIHNVATGKGLGNVSEMDRLIWKEFGEYPEKVRELAALIRNGIAITEIQSQQDDNDEIEEFSEGRILTELHKRKERNPKIRKQLIASRRKDGPLGCDVCHINSVSSDPVMEDAMFEAHHLEPMALALERVTKLSDMALLCANCHRLLHRAIAIKKNWLTIAEIQQLLYGEKAQS